MKRYDLEGLLNQVNACKGELNMINSYIETSQNDYSDICQSYKDLFISLKKEGKDPSKSVKCHELKKDMEALKDKEAVLYTEQLSKQIELSVIKSNYKMAVATVAAHHVASAVEKFSGKKLGPATIEKIESDFNSQMPGYRLYISKHKEWYNQDRLTISGPGVDKDIAIYPINDEGSSINLTDEETGKIIPCLKYRIPDEKRFIRSPKEQSRLILEQFKKVNEAKQALNKEVNAYNDLLPCGYIDHEPTVYENCSIKLVR